MEGMRRRMQNIVRTECKGDILHGPCNVAIQSRRLVVRSRIIFAGGNDLKAGVQPRFLQTSRHDSRLESRDKDKDGQHTLFSIHIIHHPNVDT
jgi:hypothetical protein